MELHLGKMTNKELAEWFGMAESSFWKKETKEKKLSILERYAIFHLEGNKQKSVVIDEILEPVYGRESTFERIKQLTKEKWNKSGYDTCANVAKKTYPVIMEEGYKIKDTTNYRYVCKGRTELYGSPLKHTEGELGTCHYEWCKLNEETLEYEALTEEEKAIKDRVSAEVGLTSDEETCILDKVRKGKLTKEEFWEYVQDVRLRIFDEWIIKVQEALGFPIYRCTKIEDKLVVKEGDFAF
jgi:hypothetical protein